MAPTRKSRSVNRRYSDYVDVSPSKTVANKSGRQKRKLSDMLGSPWIDEEVERFYKAYRKYGKDWKKVAAMVRTRNSEMVEALYTMNRAYLSLPEGTASVVGFIAMVSDHYNALEGSDNEKEINDLPKLLHKPKKRTHKLLQQNGGPEDQLQSRLVGSSDRSLPQLKRRESDGCTVRKRTPRFAINHLSRRDNSISHVSPYKRIQKKEVDDVAHGAALALTEALQRGGSPQASQSPYRLKTTPSKGRQKILDNVRAKLHGNLIDEECFEGSSGSGGAENVGGEEFYQKRSKFYGQKDDNEFDDGGEACSGTGEGLAVGVEAADENIEQSSSQGKRKRNKKLFFRDETSGLDALQTLADLSLLIQSDSPVLKEDKPPIGHRRNKTKFLADKKIVNEFPRSDASKSGKSKSGRESKIDYKALFEGRLIDQFINKSWKRKNKSSAFEIILMAEQPAENVEILVQEVPFQEAPVENVAQAWPFEPPHNCCAFVEDVQKNTEFTGIIDFLRRSRIIHSIATPAIIYKDIVEEFWSKARYDFWEGKTAIVSEIQGEFALVTEEDIREALKIKNDDCTDPRCLSWTEQRVCFLRMKYNGPITDGALHKGKLSVQFKYFAHVIIHVFGTVSGGYDVMRKSLSSLMVALTLNKPFNIAGMILDHMLEMLKGLKSKKFLLYPRFLMMIFDHKYPKLKKDPTMVLGQDHMNIRTLVRMKGYKGIPNDEKPPYKNLFGHLINPGYTDPGENKARHANSESDTDDPLVHADANTKRKRQVKNAGAKGKGKANVDEVEPAKKHKMRKKSTAGESESLNKAVEEQLQKEPIDLEGDLGLDTEDFDGSTVVVNLKKPKHKSMAKRDSKESTKKLREKEIEKLLKGKKVPEAGTSSQVSSPATKKQKNTSKEPEVVPDLETTLENVFNLFQKKEKEKTPVAESSKKKVTVSDDVMKKVNKQLEDMMKMLTAQQAQIEKFKKNEEKMLQIVVASKTNQDELEKKLKQLEEENNELDEKCNGNRRMIKSVRKENKELKKENKRMSELLYKLYGEAPKLKEGEEDKEKEE